MGVADGCGLQRSLHSFWDLEMVPRLLEDEAATNILYMEVLDHMSKGLATFSLAGREAVSVSAGEWEVGREVKDRLAELRDQGKEKEVTAILSKVLQVFLTLFLSLSVCGESSIHSSVCLPPDGGTDVQPSLGRPAWLRSHRPRRDRDLHHRGGGRVGREAGSGGALP